MGVPLISAAERSYITQGAEANLRSDGRRREDFRRMEVQVGVLAQCNGSARVRLGGTDVVVRVKAEIGAPEPWDEEDRPEGGP